MTSPVCHGGHAPEPRPPRPPPILASLSLRAHVSPRHPPPSPALPFPRPQGHKVTVALSLGTHMQSLAGALTPIGHGLMCLSLPPSPQCPWW